MKIKNFNKEYIKYLFPQRTRLTTEYQLTADSSAESIDDAITVTTNKDFDMVRNFLPNKCDNCLDIGCGLALIDICLYKHYENIELYLLDKTELDTDKIYGFNEQYRGYNSMQAAKETLLSNDIKEEHIHLYETTKYDELYDMKFDIISSFLSCGWHYSVNTYLDLMQKALSPDGVLILDVRHNTGELEILNSNFVLVKQIFNYAESKHTGGNIGDRYIFKKKQ